MSTTYAIDGGTAAPNAVGKAPVDLVSTWVRSPLEINRAAGVGALLSAATAAQVNSLYSLGMQMEVIVDMSLYPLYALSPQFQTDLAALAANYSGGAGPYGNLYVVLHDGVENYNGTDPITGLAKKARMTAPLTAVPGSLGPTGNFVTITYQSSGGKAFVGTPVLQNGDTVYLDECIGLATFDSNGNPCDLPTTGFTVNGCSTNTGTGITTFNALTGSLVVSALNPAVVVLPQYNVTTTSASAICTVPNGSGGWPKNLKVGATVASPTSGLVPSGTTVTAFEVTPTGPTGSLLFHLTLSQNLTASASGIELDFTQPTDTGFTTAVFGGWLKTDSVSAVLHGTASTYGASGIPAFPGLTSTADYRTALMSTFGSVRAALKTAYRATSVGVGLTSSKWTSSVPIDLSPWAAALALSDFSAVNVVGSYQSEAAMAQSLGWAAAQLSATGLPLMVSWFDLYDPAAIVVKNADHYTNLTTAFTAFMNAVFIDSTMTTLTNQGLFAWNFYNDDYLNTMDYGTSFNDLVRVTNRYAVLQHSQQRQTANARIQTTPAAPQQSNASISIGRSNPQSAVARISTGASAPQFSISRISLGGRSIQAVASRIVASQTSPQLATARVSVTAVSGQWANATIIRIPLAFQQSTARIVASTSTTQQTAARISLILTAVQRTNAQLAAPVSSAQPAAARLVARTSATQRATAAIAPAFVSPTGIFAAISRPLTFAAISRPLTFTTTTP